MTALNHNIEIITVHKFVKYTGWGKSPGTVKYTEKCFANSKTKKTVTNNFQKSIPMTQTLTPTTSL